MEVDDWKGIGGGGEEKKRNHEGEIFALTPG